jgi:hypothetical protein
MWRFNTIRNSNQGPFTRIRFSGLHRRGSATAFSSPGLISRVSRLDANPPPRWRIVLGVGYAVSLVWVGVVLASVSVYWARAADRDFQPGRSSIRGTVGRSAGRIHRSAGSPGPVGPTILGGIGFPGRGNRGSGWAVGCSGGPGGGRSLFSFTLKNQRQTIELRGLVVSRPVVGGRWSNGRRGVGPAL